MNRESAHAAIVFTDTDDLVVALDAADVDLRTAYRELADDPDRGGGEAALRERQSRRRDLCVLVASLVLRAHRERAALPTPTVTSPTATEPTDAAAPSAELVDDSACPPASPLADDATPSPETSAPTAPSVAALAELAPATALVSASDLRAWKEAVGAKGLANGTSLTVVSAPRSATAIAQLLDQVGAPRDLDDPGELEEESRALEAVGRDASVARWAWLGRELQVAWLSMLAARSRAVRERSRAPAAERARALARACVSWSALHRPGFVNGLQRAHSPIGHSWGDDAQTHWRTLAAALGDKGETRRGAARCDHAPASPRSQDTCDDSGGEIESPVVLPRVAALGLPIVIVGGEGRHHERLERLRERTRVAIEWVGSDDGNRVAVRVRSRRVGGVVVVNLFARHSTLATLMDATRQCGVPVAYAEKGGMLTLIDALLAIDARLAAPAIADGVF